jgi:hypothetical protein
MLDSELAEQERLNRQRKQATLTAIVGIIAALVLGVLMGSGGFHGVR